MTNNDRFVYLVSEKGSGLFCSKTSLENESFSFYVHNGEWYGAYHEGKVYILNIFDDGYDYKPIEKDYKNIPINSNSPVWIRTFVDAINNRDKKLYYKCQHWSAA